ncbi:GYD domain-containing protein [Bacteroidota bacterium]
MAKFICLVSYTTEGLRQINITTKRAGAFTKRVEQLGGRVLATYWTLGIYDIVHIIEAENAKVAASLAMSLGSLGNVKTHTMVAFSLEEMQNDILKNIQNPYDLLNVDM